MPAPRTMGIAALMIVAASGADAFNGVECIKTHTREECMQIMTAENDAANHNTALTEGEVIMGTSKKYTVTVPGADWVKNGFGQHPEPTKDLGLYERNNGNSDFQVELTQAAPAVFRNMITSDLTANFTHWQEGLNTLSAKDGKLPIKVEKTSEIELLTMPMTPGNGVFGRYCYRFTLPNQSPNTCVYEGFATNTKGDSVKFVGHTSDYGSFSLQAKNLTTMLKLIGSFKFTQ